MKLLRASIFCILAATLGSCATSSETTINIKESKAYNFYYPKVANDNRANYRNWFDKTFFSTQEVSTLTEEQQTFRSALDGDSDAIHLFFHNQYREEPGEFSVVWANQALLLLITLGDKFFVKHLLLEDVQTQKIVSTNLRALTMTHPDTFASFFPETSRLLRVLQS